MALASAQARYDELHKTNPYHDGTFTSWGPDPTTATPFHYRDGVTLWVASVDLSPGDDFLGSRPSDQPPDDDDEGSQGGE